MPEPVYVAENCKASFQLLWTLALFWNARVTPATGPVPVEATIDSQNAIAPQMLRSPPALCRWRHD